MGLGWEAHGWGAHVMGSVVLALTLQRAWQVAEGVNLELGAGHGLGG